MNIRGLFLGISIVVLVGCASSSHQTPEDKVSVTTVDPALQDLQDKVDELEARLNSTTLAPSTTFPPKPTQKPYITRTSRFPSGYSKFVVGSSDMAYECRIIDYYSDGTSVEGSRYWVTVEKWHYGACG